MLNLKHAPIQTIAHIVGHSNVNTTLKYNRYYPNPEEVKDLQRKALKDK